MPANRGEQLPLGDGSRRRVEQGVQDRAVVGRERPIRGGHRTGRPADLRGDERVEVGGLLQRELAERAGDEAADALRREVGVRDDAPAMCLDEGDGGLRQRRGLRVSKEDERLLAGVEARCVDVDLRRLWEPLHAVLAVDPPEPRLERRRAGRPHEPVARVHRAKHAIELDRPVLGRLGPILGRSERVVRDEHLPPVSGEAAPQLVRPDALVYFPAVGERGEPDHAGDRRLAHLRRPREDDEGMPLERAQGVVVRTSRNEDVRELDGRRDVGARALRSVLRHERTEVGDPERRRSAETHERGSGVETPQLVGPENRRRNARVENGCDVREHEQRARRPLLPDGEQVEQELAEPGGRSRRRGAVTDPGDDDERGAAEPA